MKPQILVVDDFAFVRLIYRDALSELKDVRLVEACSGEAALELAAAQDFALCIAAVDLPDMSGFALTQRLRALPEHRRTPVVLVTRGQGNAHLQQRAAEAGAVELIGDSLVRANVLPAKAAYFIDLWRFREGLVSELDQLRAQSTRDPLTGLPNRTLFRDRLQAANSRAVRAKSMFAAAYVDLDGFKAVNDTRGHAAGDALLVEVAARLTRSLRATDTVARLGGDEFGLILEELDAPLRAQAIAEKVHASLCERYKLDVPGAVSVVEAHIGASIGLAVYPDHAVDMDRLLLRADLSMYVAKHHGGGIQMFGSGMAANDLLSAEGFPPRPQRRPSPPGAVPFAHKAPR